MSIVYGYYVPTGSGYRAEAPTTEPGVAPRSAGFVDAAQAMVEFYAQARGWRHIQWLTSPEQLGEVVSMLLHDGDVLIVPELSAISAKPSGQEQTIRSLIARGVSLHVVSLNGPVEPYLPCLRETFKSAQVVEQELAAALEREAVREASYEAERNLFEAEVVANMSQTFGVKGLVSNIAKTNGHTNGHTMAPSAGDVMLARNKLNLSQQKAADLH